MQNLAVSVAVFLLSALLIIFSGVRLSRCGDRISELTGMGRAWVGLILMASVTSVSELITGISSVAIGKDKDLASGDIFGSCRFNLLILSMLDARGRKPLFSIVKPGHIVAAVFGILLLAVAGLAIYLSAQTPMVYWVGAFTFVLIAIYLIAIRGIFAYQQQDPEILTTASGIPPPDAALVLRKAMTGYGAHAALVIGAAIFLPYWGEVIAVHTGMSSSFFGTLFLAADTSLPEVVVSFAALRMGASDMAVGNLPGSNVFNMFILGLDDVFYREGSPFRDISPSHLFSVFILIIKTAVVGLGLLFRPKRKHLWLLGFDTFLIALLYIGVILYLFFNF